VTNPNLPSQQNYGQWPGDNPLEQVIHELEELLEGKKIKVGHSTVKWTVKGAESAATTVATGFTTLNYAGAFADASVNSPQFIMGLVGFVAGGAEWKMRLTTGEVGIGTEIGFFWIAIGE
jgi:hypothetical protein